MSAEKKIKIAVLTTVSKTMDWFIVDSMRNLAKNGYEVTLISNMEEGFAERNSDYAKCIHLPMSRGASVKDLLSVPRKLKKIFKAEKADLVQTFLCMSGFTEVGLAYPLTAKYHMNLVGIPTENVARNRKSCELTDYARDCMKQMKLASDYIASKL